MIKNNKPLLSILIPTRNRAAYLKYAIQSAINISSDLIEIIVSENHSVDESWDVCNSFLDPRLRVVKPPAPLPMHENWEYLLNKSCGEWVVFIGDDDAIMPHSVEHLKYLGSRYPAAEAIVSRRAYYFWDGCQETYGTTATRFDFSVGEKWHDSKKQLKSALSGEIDYIHLPQMYSGGFQRRSLINRVLRSQNGVYFKSVSPDAYSALMACVHTYRYIETKIPMSWVGSSPHKGLNSSKGNNKDRQEDFFGLHNDDTLTMHRALGDLKEAPFSLYFFEAYLSAFPTTSSDMLSVDNVKKQFLIAVRKLRMNGGEKVIRKLADDLGFDVPPKDEDTHLLPISRYGSILLQVIKQWKARIIPSSNLLTAANTENKSIFSYRSDSHQKHPDVLSCDELLAKGYALWCAELPDETNLK